jgi:hypothetical protein
MNNTEKVFGDPNPTICGFDKHKGTMVKITSFYPQDTVITKIISKEPQNNSVNLDKSQTDLLKTVVQFLDQINSPFYTSNQEFINIVAHSLSDQIRNKFQIG